MVSEPARRPGAGALLADTLLVVALIVVAMIGTGCRRDEPLARPNVLVVCIDALRADRLGLHGASPSPSPVLDALARDSVVFENATSVASWTKPSVPSILTGLYPQEHGVLDNSSKQVDTLPADTVTLARTLRDSGYRTGAFVENDQLLGRLSGLDNGFSVYLDEAGRPPEIVDRFLTWTQQESGAPWFAYLHFLDPHFPYTPDEFTFAGDEAARLRVRIQHWDLRSEYWWMLRRRVNEGSMRLDDDAVADLDRLYRLEIQAVDASIGRMLNQLQTERVLDRTMVIVTADHGEGFLERGLLDHGYGPYQELLHVPLVVRMPGGESGGTQSSVLAQNVDIAATVLARVGLPVPTTWTSVSLLPALRGSREEARAVALAQEEHGRWKLLAARDQRYSYVRSEEAAKPPRPHAVVPASATAGTRIRVRGIYDDSRLVAGYVKWLEPRDPDTEILGPVDGIDVAARTIRLLGVTVMIGDGVPVSIGDGVPGGSDDSNDAMVTMATVRPGELLRAHGSLRDGLFAATKIDRVEKQSIEIEGIVRSIEVLADGDARIDLGDVVVLVDPRARWSEFPGKQPPPTVPVAARKDTGVTEQLFDRRVDPGERHDIAAVNPPELARMRDLAERATSSLQAGKGGEPQGATLDDETRERLRAMGYVE